LSSSYVAQWTPEGVLCDGDRVVLDTGLTFDEIGDVGTFAFRWRKVSTPTNYYYWLFANAYTDFSLLATAAEGAIQFYVNGTSIDINSPPAALWDGKWHTVVIRWSDATNYRSMFVDRFFYYNNGIAMTWPSNSSPVVLGRPDSSTGRDPGGIFSWYGFWNHWLDNETVNGIMDAPLGTAEDPLFHVQRPVIVPGAGGGGENITVPTSTASLATAAPTVDTGGAGSVDVTVPTATASFSTLAPGVSDGSYPYTVYYDTPGTLLTYAQYASGVAALATSNGWTQIDLGDSENGREIFGVIINPSGYTKTVYLQAGVHGNETWSIRCLYDLLNYFDQTPAAIESGLRYIIVPILNVDGYIEDTRKNDNDYADDGKTPWPRYVNINRNLSEGWGESGSGTPADQDYWGPEANSEAESQALVALTASYPDIDLFADTHTTQDEIRYYGGYYAYRKPAIDAALLTNGFDYFTYNNLAQGGSCRAYLYGDTKVESYNFEMLQGTSTVHEQVNRYICAMLAVCESLMDPDNVFNWCLDKTHVVGHYRWNEEAPMTHEDLLILPDTSAAGTPLPTIEQPGIGYITGDGCLDTGSGSGYLKVLDADLPSNFPLKSGTSNKEFAFAVWLSPKVLPISGDQDGIITKYNTDTRRSFAVIISNTAGVMYLRLLIGYNSGADYESVNLLDMTSDIATGEWFLLVCGIRDSDKYWMAELWDTNEQLLSNTGNYNYNISLSTADLRLFMPQWGSYHFNTYAKELILFDQIPTSTDIAQIHGVTFGMAGATNITVPNSALALASQVPTVEAGGTSGIVVPNSSLALAGLAPVVGLTGVPGKPAGFLWNYHQ